jgi:hypothetical protein
MPGGNVRYVIVFVSTILTICSLAVDRSQLSPDSWMCRQGFCRIDQEIDALSSPEGGSTKFGSLVLLDASNPFVWCTYADSLASGGERDKASAAFDTAVTLGPNMPPVLMRAANFDFTHDRIDEVISLSNRILRETDAFDQVLFSYLTHSGLEASSYVDRAIPKAPRPAQSWLAWLGVHGSDEQVRETWAWMKQNNLIDEKTAEDTSWALWRRGSFRVAREVWFDWLVPNEKDGPRSELLLNSQFQERSTASPFDWVITTSPSVRLSYHQGLQVGFTGSDNPDLLIQQFTGIDAGRYRFSAEIESEELSTEDRPFFRIVDAVDPKRLNIRTDPIDENQARRIVVLNFTVPPGTEAIAVQLVRTKSERFDGKIEGSLHAYQVSLTRIDQLPQ